MTIQLVLVDALKALGEKVIYSPRDTHQANHKFSRKYITMTRAKGGYYFLGKGGALRVGAVVTRSNPVSEKWRKALLATVPQPKARDAKGEPQPMFDMGG